MFKTKTQESSLESIGVKNITVSGDTRLDSVYELLNQDNQLKKIAHFVGNQLCFVAGSTWEEDYNLMNDFLTSPKDQENHHRTS